MKRPGTLRVAGNLLTLAFLSLTVANLFAQPLPADTTFRWEPTVLVADRGDSVRAELGRLWVAEERGNNSSRRIPLTFIRLKSTAASPGAPIIYLAGGPGGSAQLVASGKRFDAFMRLRASGDVILLDQRGTYGSGNLLCPAGTQPPDSVARTEASWLNVFRQWSRGCVQHWTSKGVKLSAYNILESADDIEQVRQALGAPTINLWGISYGTQLAQLYVHRYPKRVGRIVLSGPEPLHGGVKLPSETNALIARLDSAVRFDSTSARRFSPMRVLIDSVFTQLDRRPARVVTRTASGDSTVIGIGRFDVQLTTAFLFGNSAFLRAMPRLYDEMANSRYEGLVPYLLRMRRYNTTAMTVTTDCATGVDGESSKRAARESTSSPFAMVANFPFPDICSDWPIRVFTTELGKRLHIVAPTLFIAGTMDGRTPPSNASRMRSAFTDSRMLLVAGASHDDDLVVSDPAIVTTMLEFLAGTLPGNRTVQLAPWKFTR